MAKSYKRKFITLQLCTLKGVVFLSISVGVTNNSLDPVIDQPALRVYYWTCTGFKFI